MKIPSFNFSIWLLLALAAIAPVNFAQQMSLHPGIVVGQLQHLGEIQYSHSRDLLVKVRDYVIENTTTDGWNKRL